MKQFTDKEFEGIRKSNSRHLDLNKMIKETFSNLYKIKKVKTKKKK